jgi:hypothetical protein
MNVRLHKIIHSKVLGVPFYVGFWGGLVSVLIDLDHPIAYWITGKTERSAHIPIAIISGIVLCFVGACLGRLHFKMVLGKKHDKNKH